MTTPRSSYSQTWQSIYFEASRSPIDCIKTRVYWELLLKCLALSVAAYGAGLLITDLGLILMGRGQPALLYLVPFALVTTSIVAWQRNEVRQIWTGKPVRFDLANKTFISWHCVIYYRWVSSCWVIS